jgi:Domain of unknown function (DUF3473)
MVPPILQLLGLVSQRLFFRCYRLRLHPRDIDPAQPRLAMPLHRRFKCYVNLDTTFSKLQRLLSAFPFISFRDYLIRAGYRQQAAQCE